jgi:hypothetical protein
MTIAFDVKGTLEGPKGKFVLGLLLKLQEMGHECVVWSGSYGYAVDCVAKYGLENVRAESKSDKWSRDEANFYDVAIEDDRGQTWLAAKKIVFVDELPNDPGGVNRLADMITDGELK